MSDAEGYDSKLVPSTDASINNFIDLVDRYRDLYQLAQYTTATMITAAKEPTELIAGIVDHFGILSQLPYTSLDEIPGFEAVSAWRQEIKLLIPSTGNQLKPRLKRIVRSFLLDIARIANNLRQPLRKAIDTLSDVTAPGDAFPYPQDHDSIRRIAVHHQVQHQLAEEVKKLLHNCEQAWAGLNSVNSALSRIMTDTEHSIATLRNDINLVEAKYPAWRDWEEHDEERNQIILGMMTDALTAIDSRFLTLNDDEYEAMFMKARAYMLYKHNATVCEGADAISEIHGMLVSRLAQQVQQDEYCSQRECV